MIFFGFFEEFSWLVSVSGAGGGGSQSGWMQSVIRQKSLWTPAVATATFVLSGGPVFLAPPALECWVTESGPAGGPGPRQNVLLRLKRGARAEQQDGVVLTSPPGCGPAGLC